MNEPTPHATAGRSPRRPQALPPELRDLAALAPGIARFAATVGVLSFISGVAEAGMLVALTAAAEATVRGASRTSVLGIDADIADVVVVGLILLVTRVAFAVGSTTLSVSAAARVLRDLRATLVSTYLALSPLDLEQQRAGVLQDRLTVWSDRVGAAVESVMSLSAASLGLVSMVVAASVIDVRSVAVLLAAAGVLAVTLRPIVRRVSTTNDRFRAATHRYSEQVGESAAVAPDVALHGVADAYSERLDADSATLISTWRRARLSTMVLPHGYQVTTLALLFAALLIVDGGDSESTARWGAVVLILVRCLNAGQQVVTYRGQILAAAPFAAQLRRELDEQRRRTEPPGTVEVDAVGRIDVVDLGVSYGDEVALDDVSFVLQRGDSLAVIGPSGAGKTTLSRVLMRQMQPTTGDVLVDGLPLPDVTAASWTSRVALVRQHPVMVSGTIRENVAFFRDVDDAAIERACRSAHVWDAIGALPGGLDSDAARSLSGGQRQRIAIARALVGDPDLLVLDEPTSALDVDSEAAIAESLDQLRGTVTTVVIAHRHSTVAHCDSVLVLRDGRVEAYGTPSEVEASSAFYRRMASAPSATDPSTETDDGPATGSS